MLYSPFVRVDIFEEHIQRGWRAEEVGTQVPAPPSSSAQGTV